MPVVRLYFEGFVLDFSRGALSLDGVEISLRPKTFSVLQYLVENPGRLVSKDEIFSAVWCGVAVTDDALVQSIGELRRALGAQGVKLISTVPRRGYRFEAQVTPVTDADARTPALVVSVPDVPREQSLLPPGDRPPSSDNGARASIAAGRTDLPGGETAAPRVARAVPFPRRRALVLGAATLAAATAFLFVVTARTSSPVAVVGAVLERQESATKASVAVLPFGSQGAELADRDYFTDGVTQDIIAALGRFSALTVMSWNSVAVFKSQPSTPAEIAAKLAVRYQVEGSVQQSGNRIRVNVQLVNQGGEILWSERFDEAVGDVFTLQDKITTQIVGALAVRVTDSEQRRVHAKPTQSLLAYDFVLRARPALQRPDRSNVVESRALLRKAVDLDPGYAAAYGALADLYHTDVAMGWSQSPAASLDDAERLATKALSLDVSDVRARIVLGRVHLFHQEYEQAEAEIDRAIVINPNDANGLAGRGNVLMWMGRTDAAIDALEQAKRIDPELNAIDRNALSLAYYLKHRYPEAIEQARQNLRQTESARFSYTVLVASFAQQGRAADAARAVTEMRRAYPAYDPRSFGSKFMNAADLAQLRGGLEKAGL